MQVRLRLFAGLRERAGADELAVTLPDGARVADALAAVLWLTDGVPVVMAVNREYADETRRLAAGDELALIPPVSGGAPAGGSAPVGSAGGGSAAVHARVLAEPLSLDRLTALVRDPRAGAIVTFSGVTREVAELQYEAYREMAEPAIAEVVARAVERFGLCRAAAEHRTGSVPLSESSVAVAVSAPHRPEAFDGARAIIDEIKRTVPIWKRESGRWVDGTVPPAPPPGSAPR